MTGGRGVALVALLGVFAAQLRRRPFAALASIAAMAAGVAVFVAIWCAGSAARRSFVAAVEGVAGRATHEISRPGGLDDARFGAFATLPGVEAAAPQLEGVLAVERIERAGRPVRETTMPLRLLGIDPFWCRAFIRGDGDLLAPSLRSRFLTEPNTVVVSRAWCDETGTQPGDVVRVGVAGRAVSLTVLGMFEGGALGEASRDVAVVDLATAQELLARIGRIDRIQLRLRDGAAAEAAVRAALAAGERLERPDQRSERVASMMDAFRLNILALGSLALIVGALSIFNTAQFSVVRRRPLLGQLRSLGAPRVRVLWAVIIEVAGYGAVGGLIGVAAGASLAQGLVAGISQTVSDLYGFVRADVAPVPPVAWIGGPVGAALLAMIAGLWPAIDAARTAPRFVGSRAPVEARFRRGLGASVAVGIALGLAAVALVSWPSLAWWPGIVAALCVLVACAFAVPPLMSVGLRAIGAAGERLGLIGVPLAAGALGRSLARAGAAAAALAVALAMAIAVIVMIASFRQEVDGWIRTTLIADLFVSDPHDRAGANGRVDEAVIATIDAHPAVRVVERRVFREVVFRGRSVQLVGTDLHGPSLASRYRLLRGDDAWPAALQDGAVIVSEPFATRFGVGPGGTIALPGRRGTVDARVVGVFRDFSVDRGYVLFGRPSLVAGFGDPGARNVAVYLRDGADVDSVATALRRAVAGEHLVRIRSNAQLRAAVFNVFDRTFAVTRALQFIAVVIALVGIAVTLSALYLERAREIATLRALGATMRRVAGVFCAESVLMTAFPALIAVPLGGWLAWILVHVINFRSFGWSLDLRWPVGAVSLTVTGAVLAGVVATWIPWWFARRDRPAASLREE